MVVNKSASSLLDLLEWREPRLSAGGPSVNYKICHADVNEHGKKVK
jgi:hypothetical protein